MHESRTDTEKPLPPYQYHLESVERVMRLLGCFSLSSPELRLIDLAKQTGMSKTQALRIAATLERGGYLVRDQETKKYRLGLRLFQLGMIVGQALDLRRVVHPYLLRLVEESQETARLTVPDGNDEPVCVDVVESPHGVRVYAQLGARMPWNAGTTSKIILAFKTEHDREEILKSAEFKQFTEFTITDPSVLRAELLEIKLRGYHESYSDLTLGARGIAAPLFGQRGEIVGAISVASPESRLINDEAERLRKLVVASAENISRELGHLT